MIIDIVKKSNSALGDFFDVTKERSVQLQQMMSSEMNKLLASGVLNSERNNFLMEFDKEEYMLNVLKLCSTINEEAYCLYFIGQRVFNLENKIKFFDKL
jgi:hypothetical protein